MATIQERIERINARIDESYTGNHYGMQNVLRPRAGRAVVAGEIWQVGGDLCHVEEQSGGAWCVVSLYDQRRYTASDDEFLYFAGE